MIHYTVRDVRRVNVIAQFLSDSTSSNFEQSAVNLKVLRDLSTEKILGLQLEAI